MFLSKRFVGSYRHNEFNEVIREFQRRGIDDEEITEYVAFLLLIYNYDTATWDQLANTHPRDIRSTLDRIAHDMGTNSEPVFPQSVPHDIWLDGLYRVLAPLRALIEEHAALGLGQFLQQQIRYHLYVAVTANGIPHLIISLPLWLNSSAAGASLSF